MRALRLSGSGPADSTATAAADMAAAGAALRVGAELVRVQQAAAGPALGADEDAVFVVLDEIAVADAVMEDDGLMHGESPRVEGRPLTRRGLFAGRTVPAGRLNEPRNRT